VGLVALVLGGTLAACVDQGFLTAPPASGAVPSPAASAGATAIPGPSPAGSPRPTLPATGTWARLEVDGPSPAAREDHTWTVGEDGRTAYLFGGRDGGTVFDDLWSFGLETGRWARVGVSGAAPAPRFGHEAVWAPGRGLVIWAGQSGGTFYDDLWLFDPGTTSWQPLPGGGQAPVARYGSCSGIGPDGRLWISHGFTEDGARFADTRAYDFASGEWSDQAPAGDGPVERCLHACWWTSNGRLALYGGQTTGVPALGDLWYLTPGDGGGPTNAWLEARGQEPAARQLAAVVRRGTDTILFGGRGSDGDPLADTWLLPDSATAFVSLSTTAAPRARSGAAMVYDGAGDRILLFGGIARNALDDLWALTFP